MVDYTRSTGTAGTLLIRDLGYQIQFHLRSADGATNSGALPWNGFVNGQNVGGTVPYPSGSPWVHVASYDVGSTQDVKFGIGATGTQGFGGPTDFWQRIDRTPPAQVPSAPVNLRLEVHGHTQLGIRYDRGSDNGAGIVQDEATWYYPGGQVVWVDSNAAGYTNPQDGLYGPKLELYREYHVYIRSRNSVGWGPQAAIAVRTKSSAWVRVGNIWREAIVWVKVGGVWRQAVSWVRTGNIWRTN